MPGATLSPTRAVCVPPLPGTWGRQLARGVRPAGTTIVPRGQCQGHGQRVQPQTGRLSTPLLPAGRAGRVSGPLSPHRLFSERQQLNYRLHSVSCTGTEVHLSMCTFEFYRGNASATCGAGMPAVVSCVPGPLFVAGGAHKKKQRQQQLVQVSPQGGSRVLQWPTGDHCPPAGLCAPGCAPERVCRSLGDQLLEQEVGTVSCPGTSQESQTVLG